MQYEAGAREEYRGMAGRAKMKAGRSQRSAGQNRYPCGDKIGSAEMKRMHSDPSNKVPTLTLCQRYHQAADLLFSGSQ
jgi:hypothetical protein